MSNLHIQTFNNHTIAEPLTDQIIIYTADDALDIMGNASYLGASALIIKESNLSKEFFDLRTGIAGEILQKFSNYRMKLAITGDFSKYTSKSLNDFIRESNKTGHICFVTSRDCALTYLTQRI